MYFGEGICPLQICLYPKNSEYRKENFIRPEKKIMGY